MKEGFHMHIRREEDGALIMTESIVCSNYSDMKHFGDGFEKLNEYEFKCKTCGAIMSITRRPIIIHDAKGRVKVQVVTETKESEKPND
jgi:hypothetical protein